MRPCDVLGCAQNWGVSWDMGLSVPFKPECWPPWVWHGEDFPQGSAHVILRDFFQVWFRAWPIKLKHCPALLRGEPQPGPPWPALSKAPSGCVPVFFHWAHVKGQGGHHHPLHHHTAFLVYEKNILRTVFLKFFLPGVTPHPSFLRKTAHFQVPFELFLLSEGKLTSLSRTFPLSWNPLLL